jgi:hypothetical protein
MKCISYTMLKTCYMGNIYTMLYPYIMLYLHISPSIALREHLQEPPRIGGKKLWFPVKILP